MLLYAMMYFSDFLIDADWRQTFGILYIIVLCLHTIVHLIFLMYDGIRKMLMRLRWAWHWRKQLYVKFK